MTPVPPTSATRTSATRTPGHTTPAPDALRFPPREAWTAESTPRALLRGSMLQAERILVKWATDPATLLQSLLFPALMVLMFWLVLDRSVSAHSGSSSVFGMVPMVALVGAMSGASISGLGLRRERMSGLLTKMWVLPVHRASAMVGRLLAEAVRIVITVSAVLAVGTIIGFRIESGVLGYVAIIGVTLIFGIAFSIMVTALALLSRDSHIVEWVAIGTNLAMFFNTGFVPAQSYPAWLRPIVEYQPLSCAVEAIRGLASGGPVALPLLLTAVWAAGLLAVFTGPTLSGYRRAASR
ncbi:peptide ABC transporter permease [Gordonia jinghuaiqii]|uniref:Transport permease protein n=1 Tax=Gordonia jinghuaiqii TaxID=2758710 RepID=A0A7D7LY41_9ACTN|nr:ABC transporter permease [Gordonia jinghuaiqii]MCR5978974.1 peptide ABC transporter permease [Gordonia jinghuaiqii]QMT01696.1 ABC transporter permease [Gordonia jinghuaiqii]